MKAKFTYFVNTVRGDDPFVGRVSPSFFHSKAFLKLPYIKRIQAARARAFMDARRKKISTSETADDLADLENFTDC